MNSEYSRLDEIADVIDSLHKTPKYSKNGYSMVRATDVKYGYLNLENTLKVDELTFNEFSRRYKPNQNDIVITRVGSYGITSLVNDTEFCLGQNTSVIVPKINSRYLYSVLNSSLVKRQIEGSVVGSTQKTLSLKSINTLEIPRFRKNIEEKIAHILSTLDDKIELNRKMNQTLEEMAQALFKSWFIDFDPVHEKMGCANDEELERAARKLGISKEVLELFPSEFEESELGMIPEGWTESILSDHISVTKGKSYKSSELEESTTALVTLKSFLRGGGYRTDGIKPYTGKYKDEQVVLPGELIMAYTDVTQAADVIGKPAIVLSDETIDILVASLDVGIVRPNSKSVSIMFLYQLFKTKRFQGYILGHTSGTTVLHLAKGWFNSYSILLPDQLIMDEFNKLIEPLFMKIQLNTEQVRSLQKARDILIPKLLSGELDVSELEIKA